MLNVKAICMARGVNASDLAAAIGVSPGYVRNVWNGAWRPSPRLKRLVAEHLGMAEEVLFRPFDPAVILQAGGAVAVPTTEASVTHVA